MTGELIGIGQAAKILGRNEMALRRLEESGELVPITRTKGGQRRYTVAQVEEYRDRHGDGRRRQSQHDTGAGMPPRNFAAAAAVEAAQAAIAQVERTGDYANDSVALMEARVAAVLLDPSSKPNDISAMVRSLEVLRKDSMQAAVLVPRASLVTVVQAGITSLGEKMGQVLQERVERQESLGPIPGHWIIAEVKDLAKSVEQDILIAYGPYDGEVD